MKIADYLSKINQKVITCSPSDSIVEAANKLRANGIGAMPVLSGENKLVGMISERDIVAGLASHGAGLVELQVKDLLTEYVIFLSASASLLDACATMQRHRFRHVPIVSSGDVIGVISIRDVLGEYVEMGETATGDEDGVSLALN